jgi:DNA helicase-2/ATP-dependent DNA helicase PcrA
VVRQNRSRKPKALWTENDEGELITLYVAEDEEDEARFVVRKILEQCRPIEASGRGYREIAVFYRINAQSRALEEELVKQHIPYTIVGGLKFYERKEIKDILAYLKLIANPSDGLSLKRIINLPPRGIGQKTIEKMEAFAREKKVPLYEGIMQALKENFLPSAAREKLQDFVRLIEELRSEMEAQSLSQLALSLLSRTGYLGRLKEEGTEEAFARVENIDELINVLVEFEKGGEEASLQAFLEKVSLVTDVDLYEDKANRISLMTLHCAKGLEFPLVFIVGMEDGLLPHHRRGDEREDLEEERRLCYVGITRAKERLFLSRAERRSTFGVGRVNLPSRFLDELPIELIRLEERRARFENLFSDRESYFQAPEKEEGGNGEEGEGRVLSPEGFFSLRIGMTVRHPKFGKGRVISVEGADEEQKATIQFVSVGSKRLKVRYANLEILV